MNPTEAMLREMAELRTFHPGWTFAGFFAGNMYQFWGVHEDFLYTPGNGWPFASTWERSCVRAANVLDDIIRNWAASNA